MHQDGNHDTVIGNRSSSSPAAAYRRICSPTRNRAEWLNAKPATWRYTSHLLYPIIDLTSLRTSDLEVRIAMHGQIVPKMLILLLAVCCLVPLAALAAVLYLAAPVWLVAPAGLLALVLLARRLMRLLAADDGSSFAPDIIEPRALPVHGHDQH
jgi:hypothetical protein